MNPGGLRCSPRKAYHWHEKRAVHTKGSTMIRLAHAIWERLRPWHEHDWKPVHTVESGWTLYRCTTCWAKEVG